MAFPISDKRRNMLTKLRQLVDSMPDDDGQCCNRGNCCLCPPIPKFVVPSNCSPCGGCMPPCCTGGGGCAPCCVPQIEMYDPSPKPCIPLCDPNCPPKTPPGPKPCVANPCDPCGGTPYIPITCPPQQPFVPVCTDNKEQPCVPCNPPSMMVAYRRTCNSLNTSKSRELRGSILHVGCECEKRNGLQDDCRRWECLENPCCETKPDPKCGPSRYADAKHYYNGTQDYTNGLACWDARCKEEYQCYPAYFKFPQCNPMDENSPLPCAAPVVCPTSCPC